MLTLHKANNAQASAFEYEYERKIGFGHFSNYEKESLNVYAPSCLLSGHCAHCSPIVNRLEPTECWTRNKKKYVKMWKKKKINEIDVTGRIYLHLIRRSPSASPSVHFYIVKFFFYVILHSSWSAVATLCVCVFVSATSSSSQWQQHEPQQHWEWKKKS